MSTRITRVLAYIALIFGIVMSFLGLYLIFQNITNGEALVWENFTTEIIFILIAIFGFVVIKRSKEIDKGHFVNVKNKDDSELQKSLTLIDSCINIKAHKQIVKFFKNLKNLVSTFKGKNYDLNEELLSDLNSNLNEYIQIMNSPSKNTEKGKANLNRIQRNLEILSKAIGKIYKKVLNNEEPNSEQIMEEYHKSISNTLKKEKKKETKDK